MGAPLLAPRESLRERVGSSLEEWPGPLESFRLCSAGSTSSELEATLAPRRQLLLTYHSGRVRASPYRFAAWVDVVPQRPPDTGLPCLGRRETSNPTTGSEQRSRSAGSRPETLTRKGKQRHAAIERSRGGGGSAQRPPAERVRGLTPYLHPTALYG